MALSDIDAQAVLKAIEVFDRLGQNALLKKYGFRRASCALPECHRRMLVLNRKMDGDALSSRGVARVTSD